MFILYDFIALIFTIFYLPVYLFRRKFHPGFGQRLGILPKNLDLKRPIWLHAVSVGEVAAIKGLLAQLRKLYPQEQFIISTVTPTGNRVAKGLIQDKDLVLYLPLDFSFIVRGVIKRINPRLFVLAETEIWPNLISCFNKAQVPIVVVNGRISDRSFKSYRRIKFFLKAIISKVSLFLVQTERDAQRLLALGALKEKVRVSGNMKFDIAVQAGGDYADFRRKLMLGGEEKLLVCGSTHPGEENIILCAYAEILKNFPSLKILIAPRHPERSGQVIQIVSRYGFRSVLVSKLPLKCDSCIPEPVFILDTIGELIPYYAAADIVFVGGSLVKKGGHNILEPASFAKPIISGEFMFNFKDIAELFKENNAALFVRSAEGLKAQVENLLADVHLRCELGERARDLILKNRGAAEESAKLIKGLLN